MGQVDQQPPPAPLVIKFGGTSVGGGAEFARAARMVAEEARSRPVAVVVSAMSGTTDTLLGYAEATAAGDFKASGTSATSTPSTTSTGATREGSLAELYRTLAGRHLAAARHVVAEPHLQRVEERVHGLLGELLEAVSSDLSLGEEGPETRRSRVAVYGERLSACILAGAVASAGASAGVASADVGASVADDPIATDGAEAGARVSPGLTRERAVQRVLPLLERGEVAVVPGFVGRSAEGAQTTLGRGGSDLSATALGAAIGSREVWICSDVDGVLDADPALVPEARLIPRLSYDEASSLAGLGTKVLHPKTVEPARAAGMEVSVRNTFNPECKGTLVCGREPSPGIRGLSLGRGHRVTDESDVDNATESAAVVCVGDPEPGALPAGASALRSRGIAVRQAGPCEEGLVFVVSDEEAGDALRALHESLLVEGVGNSMNGGSSEPEEGGLLVSGYSAGGGVA